MTQDPPPSNRLVLITERCCFTGVAETFALTSADNGATWSAPIAAAESSPAVNPADGRLSLVADGPPGILFIRGNPSIVLYTLPSALTPEVPSAAGVPISPSALDGTVVFDPAGTPVFAYGDFTSSFVRVGEAGADLLAGNYPDILSSIHLAGGPKGVLAMVEGGTLRARFLETRRLVGGALSAPVRITAQGDNDPGFPFLSADQAGRFQAVWRGPDSALVYRRSDDGGTTWTAPTTLATPAQTGSIFLPVAPAGPNGKGSAVWLDGTSAAKLLATPLTTGATGAGGVDTAGVANPSISRRGAQTVVTPRNPSLAALRKSTCVNVRVETKRPARIRVAIFSGRRASASSGRPS